MSNKKCTQWSSRELQTTLYKCLAIVLTYSGEECGSCPEENVQRESGVKSRATGLLHLRSLDVVICSCNKAALCEQGSVNLVKSEDRTATNRLVMGISYIPMCFDIEKRWLELRLCQILFLGFFRFHFFFIIIWSWSCKIQVKRWLSPPAGRYVYAWTPSCQKVLVSD